MSKKIFPSYLTLAELFCDHTLSDLSPNLLMVFHVSGLLHHWKERNSETTVWRSEDSTMLIYFPTTTPVYLSDEIHAALDPH
jgi:hypothetical protein